MSLIISQRVRFTVGQAIRRRIYSLQGRGDLDRITELTPEQRNQVRLPDNKWQTILKFHQAHQEAQGLELQKIPGIGTWTIDSAKIMSGDYSCGFITSDLAVRKWVSNNLGMARIMTERELGDYISSLGLTTEEEGKLFSKIWNHTRTH